MQTVHKIETRSFREEDRAPLTAIMNYGVPEHRHKSATGWRNADKSHLADAVFLRLSIGEPAIAMMEAIDRNTTPRKMTDVCEFNVFVAHEYRRQGIGALLYEKAQEFACERGAKRLRTLFCTWTENEPAIAFLESRGFSELEREQTSYLDLTAFDPASLAGSEERARAAGVRFFSCADVGGDTEENRRRIYEMIVPIVQALPQRDDQPVIVESFEVWSAQPRPPEADPALLWIAACGGEWIGYTRIVPRPNSTSAMQWLTGVLAVHQGKGVATTLKAKAYQAAKARGFTVITTENHEMNGPMLAVNKKFGFIPEAPEVTYHKTLVEEEPHADSTKN